ncbi:MAG: glycosyltransferase family 4 protein [Sphingomonas sp.]|uniref:glycosyltransferase family 4 protein n=1 Tax=Sphingomonas sp. TaxID=28214 RepID=UPI00261BD052|nr:glycosyltransferase family 4 protein [Sphingomonas sp.]MDK2769547.1 glycosyltransferase family 4 protein [Sphingomonas sp.]
MEKGHARAGIAKELNLVDRPRHGLRVLYLATDAYGGHGGIALFSRNLIEALDADDRVGEIVCPPRIADGEIGSLPAKLTYDLSGLSGRGAYLRAVLRHVLTGRFDAVIVPHINLAPVAWAAAKLSRARWALCLHGIDAWPAAATPRRRFSGLRADAIVSVSALTLGRFRSWCPVDPARCVVIPNAMDFAGYAPGPRDPALEARYGLAGKRVILTLGRLDPAERYKGFDEIIELLPDLAPDITYLIAGKGEDRARLEAKAAALGVADRVVFAGMVPEAEKVATYRLADVYAMPSTGEGFGFVFLEAMACGIPTVASDLDGGREAVREGELGQVVDPADRAGLKAAVLRALDQPKGVPEGLDYFGLPAYRQRISDLLTRLVK